jgi:hypothetical protein
VISGGLVTRRRVGIEVWYENLSIEADVYVGKRARCSTPPGFFIFPISHRHMHIFVSSCRHKVLTLGFGVWTPD